MGKDKADREAKKGKACLGHLRAKRFTRNVRKRQTVNHTRGNPSISNASSMGMIGR